MATPDEDHFEYSSRFSTLRQLATGDPDDRIFTDELIALLEERDKQLEYFLNNRVTSNDLGGSFAGRMPFVHVAGRWYDSALTGDANATSAVAADQVFYIPVSFPFNCTLTDVAVDVTATTGGNIRLGLYNTDTTGIWVPGALNTTFGTMSITTTGGQEINSLSVALTGGVQYWLAYQSDTARTIAVMGPEGGPSGGFASSGTNTPTRAVYTADTYASGLPATAGALVSDPVDGFISMRFKIS